MAPSILMLLPLYHRAHDAKLLMLTIPACAMLWAQGGKRRWISLSLTGAAIFLTGDVLNILLLVIQTRIAATSSTLGGKMILLALHPAPLILLATACFYLWVYIRYKPPVIDPSRQNAPEPATAAAG